MKNVMGLVVRYLTLVLLALGNLYLFYAVFTPFTVKPVYWILRVLYDAVLLEGNVIFFKGYYANIIPACIAGAAYYLLLILNLTTPMDLAKRVKSVTFLFVTFLLINIFRIIVFASLFYVGYEYFDLTHSLTWYIGSTVMVAIIWFANVYIFKIREIPVYSDFRGMARDVLGRHKV